MALMSLHDVRIGIVGLGYVGLPLAVYMARHFPVLGFDIDAGRIAELSAGKDRTREVTKQEFAAAKNISFSADPEALKAVNFFIVTVPTPINQALQPDLGMLEKASATVGGALKKGDIVVYESTVYPGVTEDHCVPILADASGLVFNRDFFAGYSPERINPGDHRHRLSEIIKVTSGSTPEVADLVDQVYARVVTAGTHKASSIRIAEASKVIENIQRDVNIALVNELAQLFKVMGLETREILAAAGTKWNFHGYVPGLVGGHCIGVDPYYLTHKAQSVGFHPEMILAGRRINDGMAQWVALDIVKLMLRQKLEIGRARILVMGLTFKENCPDIRNTKVVDLVRELGSLAGEVAVYDPLADPDEVRKEYDIKSLVAIPGRHVRRDRARGAPRPDQRAWRRTPAGDAPLQAACSTISSRCCRSRRATPGYECRNQGARRAVRREICGMKVLVTGVAGFIGSQTARALLARGDEVIGLDNLNDYYDVNLKLARLARLQGSNSFQFVKADLADRGEIERRVRRAQARPRHQSRRAGRRALRVPEPALLCRFESRRLPAHPGRMPSSRRRASGLRLVELGVRRQHAACRSAFTTMSTIR